jgi:hypothetical protein
MGGYTMIRVGVLTSSRADFGIYLPLLKALQKEEAFHLELIVFGTHLSKFHGYTVEQIEREGFKIAKRIESLLLGDTPSAIASAYGLTALKFAEYWQENEQSFDVVFALGDRFESVDNQELVVILGMFGVRYRTACYPLAFGNKCALFDLAFEFLRLDFTSCDSCQG